jgi:hypothetical protein
MVGQDWGCQHHACGAYKKPKQTLLRDSVVIASPDASLARGLRASMAAANQLRAMCATPCNKKSGTATGLAPGHITVGAAGYCLRRSNAITFFHPDYTVGVGIPGCPGHRTHADGDRLSTCNHLLAGLPAAAGLPPIGNWELLPSPCPEGSIKLCTYYSEGCRSRQVRQLSIR